MGELFKWDVDINAHKDIDLRQILKNIRQI